MRFFSKIINIYKLLIKKSYSTLSGAIAFFLIINGGSIAYLMLFISNLLEIDLPVTNEYIVSFLNTVESNVNTKSYLYTIFFICTSIYGASSLFFHLLKTGEMIYEETNGKFSIIRRITAIIFLAAIIFIVEICFVLLVLSKNVLSNIFLRIIRYLLFTLIPLLIVICINFFITPHEVRIKDIFKGSVITTISWYVLTFVFTNYVRVFTNYKAIYGVLTLFIVFMIWVYLIAQGLVIGIIINEKTKTVNLILNGNVKNISGTPEEEVYEEN